MNADAKTFHHGDLRAALLIAARSKLVTSGYEALSLRALARDIGVASSAPYAHFSSRDALLWALIDDGARELSAVFDDIAGRAATASERLAMAGRAYLAFAELQPELMRLIFVSPLTAESVPDVAARALDTFETLVAGVMRRRDKAAVRDVAIGCWSTLHGFAMLWLHRRLAPDIDTGKARESVVQAAVRLARTG